MNILNNKINNKRIVTILAIIFIVYLSGIIFFSKHYMFSTFINGIDVSCRDVDEAEKEIKQAVDNYEIQLNERSGKQETIKGKDFELAYKSDCNKLNAILKKERKYLWIISIIHKSNFEEPDLIGYNEEKLNSLTESLECLNARNVIEPKNPSFEYKDGHYIINDEIYGNKVNKDTLTDVLKGTLKCMKRSIDLEKDKCYEDPKYTSSSEGILEIKKSLDKYVSAKIIYDFGNNTEEVDGRLINEWINVNDDLNIEFDEEKIKGYINELCEKYNTVGKERNFKTSTGKMVSVAGGYYGWKINSKEEMESLIENIKKGQSLMKEPIYTQKAICRGDDDIGNTYVEVNITRQHLWFYKDGKLITQGDVVTGNINKGNPTHIGIYPINYKQKGATLKGFGYSSPVKYWMPFNGNIGIHDASWRNSFGGDIYKSNGTHGCVNAPLYLAKAIFEEIESGIPVICYEEK